MTDRRTQMRCRGESDFAVELVVEAEIRIAQVSIRMSSQHLWGEAGAPGGTMRRAAVRKRGSGSTSLYYHRLPE